jgi:hypothetical protein
MTELLDLRRGLVRLLKSNDHDNVRERERERERGRERERLDATAILSVYLTCLVYIDDRAAGAA